MDKNVPDLQLIGVAKLPHKRGCYRSYKLMCCGNIVDFRVDHVRNKIYECKFCKESAITKYYEDLNLTIIERNYTLKHNNGSRYVRFNKCGHEKEVQIVHAREGVVRCKECLENEIKESANKVGLEYVGKTIDIDKNYRLYKLPCGCTKELQIVHANSNSWICYNCNETYISKPNKVYLFKLESNGFSWLKLGHTCNITRRLSDYGIHEDTIKETLFIVEFDKGADAVRIEKYLHKFFKQFNLDKHKMKEFMVSGFTECYPIELESSIISELSKQIENNKGQHAILKRQSSTMGF